MLLTNGSPVWLLAAMFLTGISKGAITDYNNRVMSEYANGSATPLNMMHAAYAFGACVAPLAVLACHKLGGDNGLAPCARDFHCAADGFVYLRSVYEDG